MERALLDIVNDLTQWKGNAYTLAALVAEKQKELDREKLTQAGQTEAAELL